MRYSVYIPPPPNTAARLPRRTPFRQTRRDISENVITTLIFVNGWSLADNKYHVKMSSSTVCQTLDLFVATQTGHTGVLPLGAVSLQFVTESSSDRTTLPAIIEYKRYFSALSLMEVEINGSVTDDKSAN